MDDELLEELELPLPLLPPLFLLPLPLPLPLPLLLELLLLELLLLELLLSESLSESDDELLELLELLELSSLSVSAGAASACCAMMRLGAFCRCSRSPSVMPPKPMAVQKLIAKRVFLGLSLGKSPCDAGTGSVCVQCVCSA